MPQLYFNDPTLNIIIVLCLIIIPVVINHILNSTYNKYSKFKNSLNKTGKDCIVYFLKKKRIKQVEIYQSDSSSVYDSYSTKKNTMFLNMITYNVNDISSMSRAIYLIVPASFNWDEKEKITKIDFIDSLVSILYVIIGPAFIWFGLLFKINILIMIGICMHILHFIYHLITYRFITKRINEAIKFIKEESQNVEEIKVVEKIYANQKLLHILAFLLEGCKLFNFLLPKNMRKTKVKH